MDRWSEHIDRSSGAPFYYNASTGETTWQRPLQLQRNSPDEIETQHSSDAQFRVEYPSQAQSHVHLQLLKTQENGTQRSVKSDLSGLSLANNCDPADMRTADTKEPRKVDYLGLVQAYQQQAPYRNLDGDQACLVCHKRPSTHVFFPCQHKCVCEKCNAKIEQTHPEIALLCPVCGEHARKILPHTGNEIEEYWEWVMEIKPPLPSGFKNRFKHTKYTLRHMMAHPQEETEVIPSECCSIS